MLMCFVEIRVRLYMLDTDNAMLSDRKCEKCSIPVHTIAVYQSIAEECHLSGEISMRTCGCSNQVHNLHIWHL